MSSLLSPFTSPPEEGSIRYAQLDITAMETAQRVGAEHVQGREDRPTRLESRRRGPPNWLCDAQLDDTSKYFSLLILSISLNKLKCLIAVDRAKHTHSCASVQKFPQTIHSTKNKKTGNAWEDSYAAAILDMFCVLFKCCMFSYSCT